MKKIYKIIPLILLFVFLFSVPVSAEEEPIYCGQINEENHVYIFNCEWFNRPSGVTNWTRINIMEYKYVSSGSNDKIALYESDYSNSYEPDYGKTLECPYPQDSRYYGQLYESWNGEISSQGSNYIPGVKPRLYAFQGSSTGDNHTVKFETNIPIFATQDECTQYLSGLIGVEQAINYMKVYDCETERWVSVNIKNPDEGSDNIFDFDILDNFENFVEQSSEYNNIAQKQELVDSTSNPNDGIFQTILQAISGLIHTGNSITQQISNQIQNFVDQFFNNFAQNALGLLSEIKDSLGNILPENLTSMIDQLYESGLDSEGNFGIDTMFDYWFIPDKEFMLSQFENLKDSVPLVSSVLTLGSDIYNDFINLEPESPTLVIPAGTYSVMTLENDYIFDFEWFIPFKKYTDPVVAAFLYIGAAWRLYTHLPGILAGVTGFVESPSFSANKSLKKGD